MAVADRSGSERAALLDEICAGDETLRREVETLLRSSDCADSLLSGPAIRLLGSPSEESAQPGERFGPYEIVRQLGAGGMGAVFLALRVDDVYRKNVAIKLARAGMDGAFVLERFRAERQILAALEHPHIARLLDGGSTADGRPYFVMEYVEGKPVDVYCDEHACSINDRIRLFLDVCSAVQYAHQHLIIHRDLKPGNILVSESGVPKLLDFGISKVLSPEPGTAFGVTGQSIRLMTPDYASPEQIRGEPVTTATDIYSLGVLLYELLTGRRPYRTTTRSLAELERTICEEEPLRPSNAVSRGCQARPDRLRKRLAGDLDNILLMALRKEPARRYASVEQFADDLRRHLSHLPVRAQKDTLRYRTVKFVRRNRTLSVSAALLLLSLTGGMISTAWQARIAEGQRARAERRFNDVRRLANAFLFEFHDAIETLPGSTPARALLVRRGLEYLDKLSTEAAGDPALQRELASAYQRVGDVQGNASMANLGDTAGSLRSHRLAMAIREALAARSPGDLQIHGELSTSYNRVGDLLWYNGKRAEALAEYRKALAIRERLWAKSAGAENAHYLSATCNNVGDVLVELQDAGGALASYRRGMEVAEDAAATNPSDARAQRDLSVSYNRIGDSHWYGGRMPEALVHYRKALDIRSTLASRDPSNAVFRRDVMSSLNNIGDTLVRMGQHADALANYRRSLEITEALAAADPPNVQARRDLAIAHKNVGAALLESRQPAAAHAEFQEALATFESLAARDPASAILAEDVSTTRGLVAKARSARKE